MRKNDDLAAWRLFFRVVELGSMTKAAEESGVEPSSVSRRLTVLEQRVGTPLMKRSNRSIKLTDAGVQAYEKIRCLVEDLDNATDALASNQQALSGLVRLSMPISLGEHPVFLGWLTEFQRHHPEVEIELVLSNSYVDLLEENIDLAIRIGILKDERIVARSLGPMDSLMCASPAYLAQYGTPSHPDDLRRHRKVVYSNMLARGKMVVVRGDEKVEIDTTGQMRINHLNAIHRAVLAGAGIHLLAPLWNCGDELRSGKLVRILPDWKLPSFDVHLVRLPLRHTPQRVQALSDFLAEQWKIWAGMQFIS